MIKFFPQKSLIVKPTFIIITRNVEKGGKKKIYNKNSLNF